MSTEHPINQTLLDQLRGLYSEVNMLTNGASTDAYSLGHNAAIYSLGYNSALDRVMYILGVAGFDKGKSTAADEIEYLSAELAKARAS
jgi:hypothetical protein